MKINPLNYLIVILSCRRNNNSYNNIKANGLILLFALCHVVVFNKFLRWKYFSQLIRAIYFIKLLYCCILFFCYKYLIFLDYSLKKKWLKSTYRKHTKKKKKLSPSILLSKTLKPKFMKWREDLLKSKYLVVLVQVK